MNSEHYFLLHTGKLLPSLVIKQVHISTSIHTGKLLPSLVIKQVHISTSIKNGNQIKLQKSAIDVGSGDRS